MSITFEESQVDTKAAAPCLLEKPLVCHVPSPLTTISLLLATLTASCMAVDIDLLVNGLTTCNNSLSRLLWRPSSSGGGKFNAAQSFFNPAWRIPVRWPASWALTLISRRLERGIWGLESKNNKQQMWK